MSGGWLGEASPPPADSPGRALRGLGGRGFLGSFLLVFLVPFLRRFLGPPILKSDASMRLAQFCVLFSDPIFRAVN